MAVTQLIGAYWTRKHDLPSAPLFPSVKIYYPTSLKDLIEICSRPASEGLKAAGSHWALSDAAVSDIAFIETHDPNGNFPAMDQTRYDIVPKCLNPNLLNMLIRRHPRPFNTTNVNENEGTYFIHFETGKRIYQLYAELDRGDTENPNSLANFLKEKGNSDYEGPWAFSTLGGAGGQTVFGALNTGTHGGDHRLPPIADAIVAIHLVADGGKHYWIEPDLLPDLDIPLTDEVAVKAVYGVAEFGGEENFQFLRDTDVFNAVLVSAGRFGVVFSVVMKAVRQYCLYEERRLTTWQEIKEEIRKQQPNSVFLYDSPPTEPAPVPAISGSRFLQIAVSLTSYASFTQNLAGVTKRWNIPAVPDADNPNGRKERTGPNTGNSIPYAPDPNKPNQAQPMSFLLRACSSADFMDGVIEAVAFEIKEFVENNTVPIGGTIATVAKVAGTSGLFALLAALAALLALLFSFLSALRRDKGRLGQTLEDLRSLLLDRDDPEERAAGLFIWQCIYYRSFTTQQGNLNYGAISYAVMDQHNYLDRSCNVNVDSIEVFFNAEGDECGVLISYIDSLIAFQAGQEFQGKSFSGYVSLRFMGSSQALLGMQRWPMTCAVEIAGLKDVKGTKELMDFAISQALKHCYHGILHWGQRNTSTVQDIEDRFGNTARVRAGELQTWRDALKLITEDGQFARFSSVFTRQTGLEI